MHSEQDYTNEGREVWDRPTAAEISLNGTMTNLTFSCLAAQYARSRGRRRKNSENSDPPFRPRRKLFLSKGLQKLISKALQMANY